MQGSILSTESEKEDIVQEKVILLLFKMSKRREIQVFFRAFKGLYSFIFKLNLVS